MGGGPSVTTAPVVVWVMRAAASVAAPFLVVAVLLVVSGGRPLIVGRGAGQRGSGGAAGSFFQSSFDSGSKNTRLKALHSHGPEIEHLFSTPLYCIRDYA